jgi:hypothetical protein
VISVVETVCNVRNANIIRERKMNKLKHLKEGLEGVRKYASGVDLAKPKEVHKLVMISCVTMDTVISLLDQLIKDGTEKPWKNPVDV